jgi:hypothetical protein
LTDPTQNDGNCINDRSDRSRGTGGNENGLGRTCSSHNVEKAVGRYLCMRHYLPGIFVCFYRREADVKYFLQCKFRRT